MFSGAFCSEDGNNDEIGSNSHCHRLSSHIVPSKYGLVLFLRISSLHDTFIWWVFLGCLENGLLPLEDSDDHGVIEVNTDTTVSSLPVCQTLAMCRSQHPQTHSQGPGGPILQMKSEGSERVSHLPKITQCAMD